VFPLITPVLWTSPVEPGALALPVGATQGAGVGEDCDTLPVAVPGPVWTSDAATGATSLQAGPGVGDAAVMARALGLALAAAAGLALTAAPDAVPLGTGVITVAAGPVVALAAGSGDWDWTAAAGARGVAEGGAVGDALDTAARELALGSAGALSGDRVGAAVMGVAAELGAALEASTAGVPLAAADV
jgi:hypothetical protein